MNIVVLVKQVPDSGSERKLDPADNTVARASADNVINEMDEYAIEEALTVRDAQGGEVTVLTVGPDSATDAIRKALSMGADKAVHVVDEAIHGSCAVQTRAVIAAALSQLEYDLVLCGAESTDGQVSVMPALLAERLGIPQLSGARKLTVEGGDGEGRAADRRRLLGAGGAAAGDRVDLGHDQRAALPLVQGDHGREEEAGGDQVAGRPRRRPVDRGPGQRDQPGARLRRPPAQGRGRQGAPTRATARQKLVELPRRPEDRLSPARIDGRGDTSPWQRSWSWSSSTRPAAASARPPWRR